MGGHVLFFFGLSVLRYGRSKSGRNVIQPAGSHESLRVSCRKVMLGSLFTLPDEGSLLLPPSHIVDYRQRVVFAGIGKGGTYMIHSFDCDTKSFLCLGTRCGREPLKKNDFHSFHV